MNRAKEAVCPYCCKKYSPSNMWFRLERPLTSGEGDGLEQDYVDEKLKAYYMEFEHYDEIGAENAARIKAGAGKPCVSTWPTSLRGDRSGYQNAG